MGMLGHRVDGGDLSTTHEFLSLMLGVRRAGVTVALQALGERGLIATQQGQVTILNRPHELTALSWKRRRALPPGLSLETYGHVAGIAVHHRVPGPVCAGARVKA